MTTVRLPDDLTEAVAEVADETERSQSEYIIHVLRSHFNTEPNTPTDGGDDADQVAELEAHAEDLARWFAAPEANTSGRDRVDAWRGVASRTRATAPARIINKRDRLNVCRMWRPARRALWRLPALGAVCSVA